MDAYLKTAEAEYEAARQANHEQLRLQQPGLYAKLTRIKEEALLHQ